MAGVFANGQRNLTPPATLWAGRGVSEVQRGRMIASLVDCIEDRSATGLTVGAVVGRARMSRRTFYDSYSDVEACLLDAFQESTRALGELMLAAYDTELDWRGATRAALRSLLAALDGEPARAKLCVVEALRAGEPLLRARREVICTLAAAIDLGRSAPEAVDCAAASMTAEALVEGVLGVLHARISERPAEPLESLIDPLMSMIVLPYLGSTAAQEELSRRSRPRSRRASPAPELYCEQNPLAGLDMRLTHRTVMVLLSIGEAPGASNQEVAGASGIIDPGQMSKLLARLTRLGLVVNEKQRHGAGASNAWFLTLRGTSVQRMLRPH